MKYIFNILHAYNNIHNKTISILFNKLAQEGQGRSVGVMEEGLLHESESGSRKVVWSRPCWPTSICTTYLIYGLKSALPEAVEDGQN